MNRKEQKIRLTGLIDLAENAIVFIKEHLDVYDQCIQSWQLMEQTFDNYFFIDVLDQDEGDITEKLLSTILANADIEGLTSELDDFESELEDYMSEVERVRDATEERYSELEDVTDQLSQLDQNESIDDVITVLEEIVQQFKGWKK